MGEALHPRRVEILRYLARRAGPMGHRRECMRWGSRRFEELADHPAPPLGRLEGKGFVVRECEQMRLRPENGEYEEIMVSADEVRLQGRVVYVIHSPRRGPSGDES